MCSDNGYADRQSARGKKLVVVGVGNVLMGDEGVGVAVMRALEKRMDGESSGHVGPSGAAGTTHADGPSRADGMGAACAADFIDAGTGFFTMVSDLEGYEVVVIIDAANGGGEPGAMYRLGLDDMRRGEPEGGGSAGAFAFRRAPVSLHDFGVLESIAWERVRGKLKGKVVLFGIEPWKVELRLGLSERLEAKIGQFVDRILQEIESIVK